MLEGIEHEKGDESIDKNLDELKDKVFKATSFFKEERDNRKNEIENKLLSKDPKIRAKCVWDIASFQIFFTQNSFPFIKRILSDKSPIVRKEIARAIGFFIKLPSEEFYVKLFSDTSAMVRDAVANNYFAIRERPELAKSFYADSSPEVRREIAGYYFLAYKFPFIARKLLSDDNQKVKNVIANNIAMIYKFPQQIKELIIKKEVTLKKENRSFMRNSLRNRLLFIS